MILQNTPLERIFMAQFTNQAQLTYRDTVTNSNVAYGEIVDALSMTKTALTSTYSANDTITYVISIINSGTTQISGLTLTDNLGAYVYDTLNLTPLNYTQGSLKYYVGGALQPTPQVTVADNLVVNGITVPANESAILVYETTVNEYAPLDETGTITNIATLTGTAITAVTAEETVTANNAPNLSITKSISPVPVSENSTVTYTFLIQNTGNAPVVVTDNAFITDTFNPILTNVTATFNGTAWTQGVDYNYNEQTGLFESVDGSILVDAAAFAQGTDGVWTVTPGTSTLVVTGTI